MLRATNRLFSSRFSTRLFTRSYNIKYILRQSPEITTERFTVIKGDNTLQSNTIKSIQPENNNRSDGQTSDERKSSRRNNKTNINKYKKILRIKKGTRLTKYIVLDNFSIQINELRNEYVVIDTKKIDLLISAKDYLINHINKNDI